MTVQQKYELWLKRATDTTILSQLKAMETDETAK
jgi:hypothetical protein